MACMACMTLLIYLGSVRFKFYFETEFFFVHNYFKQNKILFRGTEQFIISKNSIFYEPYKISQYFKFAQIKFK